VDFPYYTIHREGLCFMTAFDSVYGQQRITIPFKELEAYLQPQHPLYFLYPTKS